MDSEKLETFVDGVLAIILTVIVLELPQPESITFLGFWALKTSFFAYLTSFIVVLANWYFFHIIFSITRSINGKVIAITGGLLFVMSLLPYFTLLLSENFENLYAQLCYCIYFIIVEITYDLLFNILLKIEHNHELLEILNYKRTLIHILTYAIGIIIGYLYFPPILVLCVFICVLTWFVHVYSSIIKINPNI